MNDIRKGPALGGTLYIMVAFLLGMYFMFGAVQGKYGLFQRVQVDAETEMLRKDLAALELELAAIRNKTRRLSDDYLDIDLLDQQARDVLGMARADEIILR